MIENDMRAAGVCVGYVEDRDKWRSRTKVVNHKIVGTWNKNEGEGKEEDLYYWGICPTQLHLVEQHYCQTNQYDPSQLSIFLI